MPSPRAEALVVLVVCSDRNFQRFARATLRQGGHTVFVTGVRPADVAVQVRLRAPSVVVLDIDHVDADAARCGLGRIPIVEVCEEPEAAGPPALGKWESGSGLAVAVEDAATASQRRSLMRVVQP